MSANLAKRELVLHWRKPVGKIYIVLYDYGYGVEGERTIWAWLESKQPRNPLNCSLCMDNHFQNGGECKKFPFSQNTPCGHLLARTQTPEGPVTVNLWSFNVVWQSVSVPSASATVVTVEYDFIVNHHVLDIFYYYIIIVIIYINSIITDNRRCSVHIVGKEIRIISLKMYTCLLRIVFITLQCYRLCKFKFNNVFYISLI